MGCEIKITSIQGNLDSSGSLDSITVEGTALECEQIKVTVRCNAGPLEKKVTVKNGTWTANFQNNLNVAECFCGGRIQVDAECLEPQDAECSDTRTEELTCTDRPPKEECPVLQQGPSHQIVDKCETTGNYEAQITVVLSSSSYYEAELVNETTGTVIATVSGSGSQTLTGTSGFSGTHQFRVKIIIPEECDDLPSFEITLRECPEKPNGECPEVEKINVEVSEDCNENDTRDVTFSVDISGSGTQWIIWNFDDGNTQTIDASQNPNGSYTHSYDASEIQDQVYTVTVEILGPEDCQDDDFKEVTVPSCVDEDKTECPKPVQINAGVSENCNEDGTRDITFSVDINGAGADSISWSFGDGNNTGPLDASQNPDGSYTHSYPAPGPPSQDNEYTAVVTVVSENGTCVEQKEKEIIVPGCEDDFECPKPVQINAEVSEDCNEDGTRDVTFSVDVDGNGSDTINWLFGDGDSSGSLDASQNPDGSYTHSYPAPGPPSQDNEYTVVVTVVSGNGTCVEQKAAEIVVPGCEGGETENGKENGDKDDCPWWNPRCWSLCGALLGAAIAIIVATGIAAIIAACTGVGIAAIGAIIAAGAIGLTLLGIWLAVCGRESCNILVKVLRFLTILTALSALLAFIFLFFAPPCSIGALLTSGYFGTAVSILYWAAVRFGCIEEKG